MSSLRNEYHQVAGPINSPIFRAVTIGGDILGDSNMLGDYSLTPTRFYVQPPTDEDWRIYGFSITVSSTGSQKRTDYGSIAGGLINGIDFFVRQQGVEAIVTQGQPIKDNQDLLRNGRSFGLFNFSAGDDSIFASDSLADFSDGFVLRGDLGEQFGVILNDNFTTLTQHQVSIKAANLGKRIVL